MFIAYTQSGFHGWIFFSIADNLCSSRAFKVSIFHSNISQPTNTHLGYRVSTNYNEKDKIHILCIRH